MRDQVCFAAIVLAVVGSLESSALAAEPAEASSNEAFAGLRGVEIVLRPSVGAAPADSAVRFEPSPRVTVSADLGMLLSGAAPWGAGFVGQAMLGYRFLPYLSAGFRGGFRSGSASDLADGSTNLSRSAWDAGFYVRGYPLAGVPSVSKHLDPWLGTGVVYLHDAQTFQRAVAVQGGRLPVDVSLVHHAVAVPLAVGVDYRVARFFSVGPSFEYMLANPVAGCAGFTPSNPSYAGSTYCSNESPGSEIIKAKPYGVWTVGLDLKLTF